MGCFYFYILEQIRSFITRFYKLRLVFHCRADDCRDLALILQKASVSLPKTVQPTYESQKLMPTQYDRIYVDNTVDDDLVGFEQIMQDWAPRLNIQNRYSTLLTCSTAWVDEQRGGEPLEDQEYRRRLADEMMANNRVR